MSIVSLAVRLLVFFRSVSNFQGGLLQDFVQ